MRHDLDPIDLEAMARMHQKHVLDTYKLYGQRNGIDQPEDSDHLPLSGAGAWIARPQRFWLGKAFEMLVIVLVLFVAVGLTLATGPTP